MLQLQDGMFMGGFGGGAWGWIVHEAFLGNGALPLAIGFI
jgi:hypothetical protein